MRNEIKIKLSSQYNLLFSDSVLRILVLIFSLSNVTTSPIVIVLIQTVTLLIFFYFIRRRKLGIESFLKTRSKSYPGFSNVKREIKCEIQGDKGLYTFLSIISSALISASVVPIFLTDDIADQRDIELPLYFVL